MSFPQKVWQERERIVKTAHYSIIYGLVDTWKRCVKKGSPQEADFVAGLVLESTPLLFKALSTIFKENGLQFSITSVYCHQTPKVKYAGMRRQSCEVGDLLFVHVHTPRSGNITRNALLYQAKVSSEQPHRLESDETDQLKLYTDWPIFEYYRSSPLNGERDIVPKLPHLGAQYLLIDDRPPIDPQSGLQGIPGTYPIGSCMPDKYLQDHNTLAEELFNFLLFRSGRGFSEKMISGSMDGWSQLIWDLITTGLKKAFNRRNSGRLGMPRLGSGILASFDGAYIAQTTGEFALTTSRSILGRDGADLLYAGTDSNPPREERPRDYNSEQNAGVSVVLLETSAQQAG